ncbi:unnamed protein product [Periconia digitata]|uniref:CBM21 domain-containing protein n=1 Tax=Periconia digitata TaxID=1303443 RepID=A0A9W4ULN3_9PLEO|nr:unnamed protein product [Periconia digitata]
MIDACTDCTVSYHGTASMALRRREKQASLVSARPPQAQKAAHPSIHPIIPPPPPPGLLSGSLQLSVRLRLASASSERTLPANLPGICIPVRGDSQTKPPACPPPIVAALLALPSSQHYLHLHLRSSFPPHAAAIASRLPTFIRLQPVLRPRRLSGKTPRESLPSLSLLFSLTSLHQPTNQPTNRAYLLHWYACLLPPPAIYPPAPRVLPGLIDPIAILIPLALSFVQPLPTPSLSVVIFFWGAPSLCETPPTPTLPTSSLDCPYSLRLIQIHFPSFCNASELLILRPLHSTTLSTVQVGRMPYTPPSQRSPATSKPNSPVLSRSHSYVEQLPSSPPTTQRPALPRSISSTSYLNKHRRSPSINSTNNAAANGQANGMIQPSDAPGGQGHGAISTPPDSSDDDEERGRSIGNLKELQEALQNIPIKRTGSPDRDTAKGRAATAPSDVLAQPLTANARKISHSRSSSEIVLSQHLVTDLNSQPIISSSDGSDAEEDELRIKPPLLRKKSGELVKPALRPASRRRPSSMPGTPTYHKAVHFNENMEQVRHFLAVDRPIAVSAGSSPVETYESESEYPFFDARQLKEPEWEIKLANFPTSETYERQTMPVRLERMFMASDNKTLVGTVACANLSFHKVVVARFTLDYWKTTSEVTAEYNNDVRRKQREDGHDRFNFNIKLVDQANLESKTLLLCVRYQVNGQEFWDNNNSMNYQVDFAKKVHSKSKGSKPRPIPRSRHSPPAPRPKSMPVGSFEDDFGQGFEFGAGRAVFGDSPSSSIRLKPRSKRGSLYPDQASRQQGSNPQAFSTRYDFGASLSAALSNAQTALGDRSGISNNLDTKESGNQPGKDAEATGSNSPAASMGSSAPLVPGTRPDGMSSAKPGLQSAEYNELIQKFCFYGTPSKGSSKVTTPTTKKSPTDGATEYILNDHIGSNPSSVSSSPPSPPLSIQVDGADESRSVSRSLFSSHSTSPGPFNGPGLEDYKPSSYQFGYNKAGSMFAEQQHAPQACV